MSLATLCLAVYLLLTSFVLFGWLAVPGVLLGIFAFIAGVLLLLEGVGVFTYRFRDR